MTMTREEFERQYIDRSEAPLEWFREMNRYAVPCNCDDPKCEGWQMKTLETLFVRPDTDFATEHIPDDWDGRDLIDALIAEGQTRLLSIVREFFEARCSVCNKERLELNQQYHERLYTLQKWYSEALAELARAHSEGEHRREI